MHKFVGGDTESLARIADSKLKDPRKGVKNSYVGLLLGKYDLLLDFKTSSISETNALAREFRTWIWEGRVHNTPLRGCLSSMICYELDPSENEGEEENDGIRTYTLFRLKRNTLREISALKRIMKVHSTEAETKSQIYWNPSAMSYLVRTKSNDFRKTFAFLYELREEIFLRDFCTFVTQKFDADDRNHKYDGFRALINIKLGEPKLAQKFLERFDDGRVRLGHFDLYRIVHPENLSSVFDRVKETRNFLFDLAEKKSSIRTGTVLAFEKSFFDRSDRRNT